MRWSRSTLAWALLAVLFGLGCSDARRPHPRTATGRPAAYRVAERQNDWYVQDYEVEIAQAASITNVIERNRHTGEIRVRRLDGQDPGTQLANFLGAEINLIPSNFTPPDSGLSADSGVSGFGFTNFGDSSPFVDGRRAGLTDFLPPTVQLMGPDDVRESSPLFGCEAEEPVFPEFRRQWKSVLLDQEESSLPQVETVVFPADWVAGIARRRATAKQTRRVGPWQRAAAIPNSSRLTVGDNDDLPLKAMEASVRIDGFRARVVLDLFFENDRDKQLEGNFKLRLPDSAVPYYLAFGETKLKAPAFTGGLGATPQDIRAQAAPTWDAPKEARMVPRETASQAYEQTVKRVVDPALLEWSGAGVFETRVFPLEPKKLHRIVVGYELDLLSVGQNLVYQLTLPQDVPDVQVNLTTRGVDPEVSPAVARKSGRYTWHNPDAGAIVALVRSPDPVLLRGSDSEVGAHFAARLTPQLPRQTASTNARAVFLVDVSLSENPARFNIWLDLMAQILERNRPALREFAVAFFNVETFWWREGLQPNTRENVLALKSAAQRLALEGATDLRQALREMQKLPGSYDVFLLSDGSITWGEDDLSVLSDAVGPRRPVFSYTTGLSGTDRRVLGHLSRNSGGAMFSVNEASIAKTATAHRQRPWTIHSFALEGCTDLMLRGDPKTLYPGQRLMLVGRGRPAVNAALQLALERDGEAQTQRLALGRPVDSPLAVSTYGHVAVEHLEAFGSSGPAEARAFAQHYRVVGNTCSLLMLDSEEDYKQFGIEPEGDATTVRAAGASSVARTYREEHLATLRNPKARFLQMLERFTRSPEGAKQVSKGLQDAIAAIPDAAFQVDVAPLRCKQHAWDALGTAARKQLANHELTYDVIAGEAAQRRERLGNADGLKALSSLIEDHPGDMVVARDVGRTALEWKEPGQSYHVLRRVAERRPHQLPTYLAIARCLAGMGKTDLALLYYETALRAAKDVLSYGDFGLIARFEYMRFLREIARGARQTTIPDYARARMAQLRTGMKLVAADLVVVASWNTDRTDVDLHVTDPAGEHCFYEHKETKMGGHLTADVTNGLGPEMFVLRNAAPGTYTIALKNFRSDNLRTGVRTRVDLTVYEDWGRSKERVTHQSVVFTTVDQVVDVAQVTR